MRQVPRYLFTAATLAAISVVGVSGPASAAIHPEQHCVVALGAATTGVPVASCYSTFAQAMRAAGSVTQADGQLMHPRTSVVIGIDYSSTGFTGSTLTWTESAGCGTYAASSMPTGWNDVVESVQNFNGCGTTLYQNTAFGGSSTSVGVNRSTSSLGSFNRTASSQRWCTSSTC